MVLKQSWIRDQIGRVKQLLEEQDKVIFNGTEAIERDKTFEFQLHERYAVRKTAVFSKQLTSSLA